MNQPDVRDLLACARELLLNQLLPALPQNLHYEARMVANALAIAGREIELAAACTQAEVNALSAVLALHDQTALPLEQARAVVTGNIRQGLYDARGPVQQCLFDALLSITRERLKISNPKAVPHD